MTSDDIRYKMLVAKKLRICIDLSGIEKIGCQFEKYLGLKKFENIVGGISHTSHPQF